MLEWLIAGAVVGVIGVASAILNRLRNSAEKESKRWQQEHEQAQQEVVYYNRQIQREINEAKTIVNFHTLAQLHFESMKTADYAYQLLADSRVALSAIGEAIMKAGLEKNRLITEKRLCHDYFRRQQLDAEIESLRNLRNHLFPDQELLKAQRNAFADHVKELNNRTHVLKLTIRDTCGPQGRDWYERLERRTIYKKMGLLTTGEIKRKGKVKWYSTQKEFGFIAPDNGDDDIHVSSRHLKGTRQLHQGDEVEFIIRYKEDGRPFAAEVTKR